MSLPVGITTCTVTVGSLEDFTGEIQTMSVTWQPVLDGKPAAGNVRSIVWEATGQPLASFPEKLAPVAGEASFEAPHVDQPGFIDGTGSAVTDWWYRVKVTARDENRKTYLKTKDIQVFQGQTTVDFDLIPDGTAVVPATTPTAVVTSVNGQTGAVTVAGGAVDSVNSQTGDVVLTPDDFDDTSTTHKFVTAAEKTKLANTSGTNTGDQDLSGLVPNTRTVNGHALSANVTVSKSDVGLGAVDNTADTAKPISTSQQAALDAKADLVGGVVPTSQIPAIALTSGQVVANRAAMLALTNVQEGDLCVISGTSDKGSYILTTSNPAVFANWLLLSSPTDVVTTVNGQTGTVVLGKTDVGLGNVDNTADASKPVSTLQAAADTAATTAAQASSAQRASNLSDLANASTARTNLGLGTAATQASTAFQAADSDLTTIAGLTATTDNVIQSVGGSWASRTMAQLKTALALIKGDVGLGNVDNTSDANKPVSTATALALGPRHRVWVTGRYYGVEGPYAPGTIANGDGLMTVIPFWVHVTNTITSIGAEVTTAAGAGALRFGIYGSNANDQPSGAPLLDTNVASAATTIGAKESAISLALTPGLYWLAVVPQGGGPTMRTIGLNAQPPISTSTVTGSTGTAGANCYYMTGVSGALPTWSGLNDGGQGYRVVVKAG